LCAALEACPAPWTARYRCALVYVDCVNAPQEAPLIAQSSWEGLIVSSPRGSLGFGYDPHFWLPGLGLTAAELDPHQKNQLSHRGKAMRELKRLLGTSPWDAAER
jgi:XTP/dITP diphosphohydrolase